MATTESVAATEATEARSVVCLEEKVLLVVREAETAGVEADSVRRVEVARVDVEAGVEPSGAEAEKPLLFEQMMTSCEPASCRRKRLGLDQAGLSTPTNCTAQSLLVVRGTHR